MDLKEFIKQAIKDISEAIHESNNELSDVGTVVNPKDVDPITNKTSEYIYGYMHKFNETKDYRRPVHLISFDIAVSSVEKKDGKEGIGVNVVGIKLGKENSDETKNSHQSRLKFSVPTALPYGIKSESSK